jgi:hypothetical protein
MEPVPTAEEDEAVADRPLQRHGRALRTGGGDAELLKELVEYEATAEARKLQRLADHEIILTLELQGFDTSTAEWRAFAAALAEYGYGVFMGWLHTGSVYIVVANHNQGRGVLGLNKLPEGLRLVGDDAHVVATELVIASIARFRSETLMNSDPARRWSVTGGASLKSYFVGRCLMELPDIYARWDHDQRRRRRQLASPDQIFTGRLHDPAQAGVDAVVIEEAFRGQDSQHRAMIELFAGGYSYLEIAELLTAAGHPTTVAEVRTNLHRLRVAARKGHH